MNHSSTPQSLGGARCGRIVIIGAGPTGLGAGYRLQELGYPDFDLYEANPFIGGLAHSFVDNQGFTWDIGGHVLFSHYKYYDTLFDRLMGGEFTLNDRESWVRMFDRWVPYPFQNNVRYLPKEAAFECIAGLMKAQQGKGNVPSAAAAKNFGEFIDAVFGEGIAKHFMRPYNFKVWAYPPERMNKEWIGERVAVIDVERALKNVILGTDDFGWGPNNRFKFPLSGGTGEFYRRFGPILGLRDEGAETPSSRIKLNKRVTSIDVDAKRVRFEDGSITTYDALLNTMPLDILCTKVLEGTVPGHVREAASRLLHSAGYMVGIGLKSRTPGGGTPSTKSWMYFPEPNCPFYRVTYLSNYSPNMTPDRHNFYSLLCEVSESDSKSTVGNHGQNPDAVVDEVITGLENAGLLEPGERANIVSRWCYYADYSYPTPSVERDEILSVVIPWLESKGIYSRGRFGMWKYEVANTDHSVMQGVEWVNHQLQGEAETTIGMVYKVTEDGRNAAVHERPSHAGSGEKKLRGLKDSTLESKQGERLSQVHAQAHAAQSPARHVNGKSPSTESSTGAASIGEEEIGV